MLMKKVISAVLAGVVFATSLGLSQPVFAQEAITPTASVQTSNINEVYTQYLNILQRYKFAQDNEFYRDQYNFGDALRALDVNINLGTSTVDTLHYALVDLTHNGTPELFIASFDYGSSVLPYNMYDIFCYTNGGVVRPLDDFSMGYKSYYTIAENGYLDNLGFIGAGEDVHQYLKIDPVTGRAIYDKWINHDYWTPENKYYMNYGEYEYNNRLQISKSEYDALKAQYPPKQNIEWHPIDDYMSLWNELNTSAIPVYINGQQIAFDQPPVIENGRTLVPLRGIFEALGAEVYWDNVSRSIISNRGNINLIMTIDSDIMYKNGVVQYLDVPPKIINDRTMVPLRVIGESFGCNVLWENNTVYITL